MVEVVLSLLAVYAAVAVTWITVHGGSNSSRTPRNRKPLSLGDAVCASAQTGVEHPESTTAVPGRHSRAGSGTSLIFRHGGERA